MCPTGWRAALPPQDGCGGARSDIASPVFLETIQSLTEELDRSGSSCAGQSGYDTEREDALLGDHRAAADCIVITGTCIAEERRRLAAAGIPVVETWDLTPTPIDI